LVLPHYSSMFKILTPFFVGLLCCVAANAQRTLPQPDTVAMTSAVTDHLSLGPDSAITVSIDTLTPKILRIRDSLTNAQWLDSLNAGYGFEVFNLNRLISQSANYRAEVDYQHGDLLPKGEIWILGIIAFLLVLFAVLKNTFTKQLSAVVQSFYSNRALTNLNKEDNLITSWSFLLLFIQFGFTIGMFFYLVAQYRQLQQVQEGFSFFVAISIAIILLYLLKIVCLRILGFVFNVQKPLHQYVSILYLSYFNASLLFIPIIIAFALSPAKYGSLYVLLGILTLLVIFVFQFIRAAVNILSQYRFPKLYLFLYFCTLEICPILILIKAIGL
jgi:Domain of unknown function (DUF4271)